MLNVLFTKVKIVVIGCSLFLTACAIGPDYKQIQVDAGDTFQNAPAGKWQQAQSTDFTKLANWWESFADPGLNQLMLELDHSNLDIAQAQTQYQDAITQLDTARSGFFPRLDLNSSATRAGRGESGTNNPSNTYSAAAALNWEVDIWGKIRREYESAQAGSQASAADLYAVRLSMQKTLAQTYFAIRASQLQDELLVKTLDEYSKAYQLTVNRYEAGVAALADVAAAESQLEQARVQQIRQQWQRQQQINAIAVLLAKAPSQFSLPAGADLPSPPDVPVGVPSMLLLHRPDVAAQERRVAQANASIGIAQSAWFPDFSISARGGYEAAEIASWITTPARFWSLGPALALTIFDAGARSAAVRAAEIKYDSQAIKYRQTVLDAVREVEDALVESQALVAEQAAQQKALAAADETLRQISNQYQSGLVDYLNVVQAQTSAFAAEQNAIDIQSQRLQAAVQLIAAVGGQFDPDDVTMAVTHQ